MQNEKSKKVENEAQKTLLHDERDKRSHRDYYNSYVQHRYDGGRVIRKIISEE